MTCRPNILLLMTDQQKASAMGAYGNPCVPSPFQDRLAREGIVFRDAYAVSPVCTPSRASLMTGVHSLVHQATCVQNCVPWNLPQLPELLQRAGYYTAACGHHEPRRGLGRGWHEQVDQNAAGPLHDAWTEYMSLGSRAVAWSSGTVPRAAAKAHSALLTDWMIRQLDVARRADAPFFLHLALNDPHPPYFVPPPYDTMVAPDRVTLPPTAAPDGRPAWQFTAMAECGSALAGEDDVRRVIATYYGMIAYANDQMHRVYHALEQRGMLDNTWVIMTSDHGDYTGEKQLFNKSESLYECLLHVPLVIRPPDHVQAPRGRMVEGLVELVDLMPTILRLAGVDVPDHLQGHDLVEWMRSGTRRPLRDCAFASVGNYHGKLKTTWPAGMPASGRHPGLLRGARSLEASYVRDPDYGDEAYDLRHDPHELNNLFNRDGAVPREVDRLRRRVDEMEARCIRLREQLRLVPGDRGFACETQHVSQRPMPSTDVTAAIGPRPLHAT